MSETLTAAETPTALSCTCCGRPTQKFYGVDKFCLDCAHEHEQATLYGGSVVEDMLRASVVAALSYISDTDIVEIVYGCLREPDCPEAAESLSRVFTRAKQIRNLLDAERMAG